jgi:hypothetical protein
MNWIPISPGDRVELRKPHPCGSREWRVTRIGADIGLECGGCSRRVMIDREEFERRMKRIVAEPEGTPS